MSLKIRPAAETDVMAIQWLVGQLGYDLTLAQTMRRFQMVMSEQNHAVMVGEIDGRVVGFLHTYARPAFDKPPEAVVQALAVDANTRHGGVGKSLMEAAETWAMQRGFASVSLASSITRNGAQAFYAAIGYRVFATSHLFRREIK